MSKQIVAKTKAEKPYRMMFKYEKNHQKLKNNKTTTTAAQINEMRK